MIGITEAAKRLDLSDTAINKRIRKLSIEKLKQGRFAFISEEDFGRIQALDIHPNQSNQPSQTSKPTSQTGLDNSLDEIKYLRAQLEEKDKQHFEQLELLRKQIEHERFSASNQLKEKDDQLRELQKSLQNEQEELKREQGLSLIREKRIEELTQQIKQIEYQPNEELNGMIELLEQTRESFLSNMELLNRGKSEEIVDTLTESDISHFQN